MVLNYQNINILYQNVISYGTKITSTWSRQSIGELQIIISVLFIGISFVGERYAMLNGIGPISYNACRYFISTIILFAWKGSQFHCASNSHHINKLEKPINSSNNLILLNDNESDPSGELAEEDIANADLLRIARINENRELWLWGIICGFADFGAAIYQQIGLVTISADKTSFITGMYVVFVPLLEFCLPCYKSNLIQTNTIRKVISVFLSISGLYFLSGCFSNNICIGGAVGVGEFYVFLSMLFWVVCIMAGDMAAKRVDVISMTCIAFSICTVITIILAVIFEYQTWVYPFPKIVKNWPMIALVGVCESIGWTLGTIGQIYTPPTRASLLFSLSSVVCAITGYLFLSEELSAIELFGCFCMTLAALLPGVTTEEAEKDVGEYDTTLLSPSSTSTILSSFQKMSDYVLFYLYFLFYENRDQHNYNRSSTIEVSNIKD